MQVQVLQGSESLRDKYISQFVSTLKIPTYLIEKYEQLKIADVRVLQKSLSTKLPAGTHRLLILLSPTLEAQNAILKTLEELEDQNFIFFCVSSKDDLLPTILSRAKLISFENSATFSLEKPLKEVLHAKNTEGIKKSLEFISSLGESVESQTLQDLLLSARSLMVGAENIQDTLLYFQFLKALNKNLFLTTSYNVQKKIYIENVFIQFFEEIN